MTAMDDEPKVQITENGPYEVMGDVPISRTAQEETEYGEPIGYEPFEPLKHRATYRLCRCGRSTTKPFCDDSHQDDPPFDGREVADRGRRRQRAKGYEGDEIVLIDDASLCSTAGYCGDRFTKVWLMLADSSDPAVRERIKHMVDLCPSGRLSWATSVEAEEHEPDYQPEIGVFRNGPLWVRGGVHIVGADGEPYEVRNRVTLCRCGASRNKPFCDGSHKRIGFQDG
jgi:CDGSH-type Zn-finger protein